MLIVNGPRGNARGSSGQNGGRSGSGGGSESESGSSTSGSGVEHVATRSGSTSETSVEAQSFSRASLNDTLITNSERLKQIAQTHNLPLTPVYALHVSRVSGKKQVRVVGLREKEVWLFQGPAHVNAVATGGQGVITPSARQLLRLGRRLDPEDGRLREYENAVVGARLVLAYEQQAESDSSAVRPAVTAIVQSQRTFYSIKKMGSNSLAIDQLGVVNED